MQPAEQRTDGPSGAGRAGVIRGILVIVTAVAIGAFVIARGLDDTSTEVVAAATDDDADRDDADADVDGTDPSVEIAGAEADTDGAASGGTATTDDTAAATTIPPTSETTAPAGPVARTPAEITVLVLNGKGTKGVAGRGSTLLQDAGYDVLAPKNADFLGPSLVLYTEGFEPDASAVAAVFGVDPTAVVQPLDPANPPIGDTQGADIIVVIGEDGLIDV